MKAHVWRHLARGGKTSNGRAAQATVDSLEAFWLEAGHKGGCPCTSGISPAFDPAFGGRPAAPADHRPWTRLVGAVQAAPHSEYKITWRLPSGPSGCHYIRTSAWRRWATVAIKVCRRAAATSGPNDGEAHRASRVGSFQHGHLADGAEVDTS